MSSCEMCGKDTRLVKVRIEGAELEVCANCARFGTVIQRHEIPERYRKKPHTAAPASAPPAKRPETLLMIAEDYADKIKSARDELGLTQEEFAKKLNEKHSIIQKIETRQFKPSIEQARRFEKALGIELVEEYKEEGEVPLTMAKKSDGFTLGDFVKKRK